jgi:hypothetical protein
MFRRGYGERLGRKTEDIRTPFLLCFFLSSTLIPAWRSKRPGFRLDGEEDGNQKS